MGFYEEQILPRLTDRALRGTEAARLRARVVSVLTLCTIPAADRAPAEIRRVLRPAGAFHFMEHGLSPQESVARWQHRLTPLQRRVFGGCHINRPIGRLVADAGLELTRLDNYYVKGPRAFGYMFDGVAIKPGR